MPQITLEFTANVRIDSDWGTLLPKIHQLVSKIAGIPIGNCKSRILEHTRYYVGDGSGEQAFVHLEIAILEGRDDTTKAELGNSLLSMLQTHLLPENAGKDLQITVEIKDINRKQYFKFPKGSISN